MRKDKSSISQASSYKEIGEFWDSHSLSKFWKETEPARFSVDVQSEQIYYPIDSELSAKIDGIAKRRGISSETLANLLLQEKIRQMKKSA
ncbi:MAG: BrnA antitoxin family protein [Bacteroidetes bacterium]|nr:BrnA antitoxin family protein [Bacteroidota bacterium]MCL5738436.1 BrnA antitoxin family protein [Bacteroidota bacterium]